MKPIFFLQYRWRSISLMVGGLTLVVLLISPWPTQAAPPVKNADLSAEHTELSAEHTELSAKLDQVLEALRHFVDALAAADRLVAQPHRALDKDAHLVAGIGQPHL